MSDEKKNENDQQGEELSLEELEAVSGGSIRNVRFTTTRSISEDTKRKI